MGRYFITTAIPYVNGRPHVGFALELVQADVLARHRRQRGDEVRLQTGTDDNSLKNVHGAEAAGVSVPEYVERVAAAFAALGQPLDLSFDDFIKTSSDPRHAPGVNKIWAACADRGDLYRKSYSGLYCVGCEQFYAPEDLAADGTCPEHGTKPDLVEEDNWFFRLSNYTDQLREIISTDQLRIEPASRKREVLSFIESGLDDFSVSRSTARARGWGIPVPGDPGQVIYVWYDALVNYISAPGYGHDDANFDRWWNGSERVHIIGKGIIRFHAVYWPAMLLSAGVALPNTIFVHEYLTVNGQKISKSAGNAENPADIVGTYGVDALRWWVLREVARAGDTDFTIERMVARANEELANNIGNFVNRTVSMIKRYRDGVIPELPSSAEPQALALRAARDEASATIDAALADFDFRRATEAVTRIGDEANRYVEATAPWDLAKAEKTSGAERGPLDGVLAELAESVRAIAEHLRPFLPGAAERITQQLGDGTGQVATPSPVFPRLEAPAVE